ncbi:FAD-dependent oxidoreductase [Amycolatopsis sp. NPDC005961]|uniref:FAD-dependent oxidoreductase n=1 Tax=Amycolatopsis sp. NPDC005961 TaxID=3156720 RepID=UPI0033DFC0A0
MSAPQANPASPTFTRTQWERLKTYGEAHDVQAGEWLFRAGEVSCDLILVERGRTEILRRGQGDDPGTVVASYGPGQFSGELNLLTGQATYLDSRVAEAGAVYRVGPDAFRRLMSSDGELSDVVLRALLARRQVLRANEGARSVELLGAETSAAALALRTYVARQQLPHTWTDIESPAGRALALAANLTADDLPAVVTATAVLKRATPGELAEHLGYSYHPRPGQLLDVVVVGGGPAGLAAAVYGASEGLDTLLLDTVATGGQAAASSRIENYLGFTSGISGAELTGRATIQAQKFGARIASPCQVARLDTESGDHLRVVLEDGTPIDTRAVVIASGARYKALPLERWSEFEGAGIYYAATELEARACGPNPAAVVGGANSAGQAALYLAERGSPVTLVVRGADLYAGMSAYLADRIVDHPRVKVRTSAQVTALHGDTSLERIDISGTDPDGNAYTREQACVGLFCFIGATPATEWMTGIAADRRGFILTDARVDDTELGEAWQKLGRRPLPFETSQPGVFAAGDVRAGSMKRVAAAVGEGASAISSVHSALGTTGV